MSMYLYAWLYCVVVASKSFWFASMGSSETFGLVSSTEDRLASRP
jgi:hypothetical protein